jgi:hypothetical protein
LVLCITVVVIGLPILPSARHRIYEEGEASVAINRFITTVSGVTLLPFALALALDLGSSERSWRARGRHSIGCGRGLCRNRLLVWRAHGQTQGAEDADA